MADSSENVEKADGIVIVPNGEISQDSTNVSGPEATGQGQPPVQLPMWKFTLILVALCITVLCMALVREYHEQDMWQQSASIFLLFNGTYSLLRIIQYWLQLFQPLRTGLTVSTTLVGMGAPTF